MIWMNSSDGKENFKSPKQNESRSPMAWPIENLDESTTRPPSDLQFELDDLNLRVALARIQERLAYRVEMVGSDLDGQHRLIDEIQSWTGKLDQSVERTNYQVDVALETFTKLVGELNVGLTGAFSEMDQGLEETRRLLDDKRVDLETVLDSVGQIGKTIRMLSINAQIASAKAGEHGKTFSVVAQEIKGLANEATESSNEAVKIMNLADVEKLLANFATIASDTLSRTNKALNYTDEQFRKVVEASRAELAQISTNSRIVAETIESIQVMADRLVEKNKRAGKLSRDLEGIWLERDPGKALQPIIRSEKVQSDPNFDRLDHIRAKGAVRIAIEPDFKGLSFRFGREPLRGLDVEYAKAFARWIGVECQFVEFPWDQCTNLLWVGRTADEPEADLMWSALPPSPRYHKVAYSDTYTYLEFVLARRKGDSRIQGLSDLNGRALGCINDPAALKTLEDAGVRWSANADMPGGRVRLGNLITYSDQGRIHDCLADGVVDAFAVDRPIYHWACTGHDSPWKDRIEILAGNLASQPWYYSVGVADTPSSFRLLREVNRFLKWYRTQSARRELEQIWQGGVIDSRIDYHSEKAGLRGAQEMLRDYESWIEFLDEFQPDDPTNELEDESGTTGFEDNDDI